MENNPQLIETENSVWTAPRVEILDVMAETRSGLGVNDDGYEGNTGVS